MSHGEVMNETSDLKVGQRWMLSGRVRELVALEEYPERGPGLFAALVPVDRTPAEAAKLKGRGRMTVKPGEPAWTDWWLAKAVVNRGQLIPEGEEAPVVERRGTVKDAIRAEVEDERKKMNKRRVLTPLVRAQNRRNSARSKLKHPEKSGRSEWTALERAEIEATIADAEAEIARLKGE